MKLPENYWRWYFLHTKPSKDAVLKIIDDYETANKNLISEVDTKYYNEAKLYLTIKEIYET